jgi:hypothetical protein
MSCRTFDGEPWAVLLSAFGGGTVWAFGASVPLAAGTAATMLGTATVMGGHFARRRGRRSDLRRGTRQAMLIDLLDGHLRSLRGMRKSTSPGLLRESAAEALAAADGARRAALRVATAIDELDATIAAAHGVTSQGSEAARMIRETGCRLRLRRDRLLEGLTGAVDEVATVYARLLELSATARTIGVSLDSSEVTRVNDTSILLQATFAELEADVAGLPDEGLF